MLVPMLVNFTVLGYPCCTLMNAETRPENTDLPCKLRCYEESSKDGIAKALLSSVQTNTYFVLDLFPSLGL